MKIRTGFISNSSSSSFIVSSKNLSKEIIDKLLAYGFDWTAYITASDFAGYPDIKHEKEENLGLLVPINEDEVIEFLLKLNITFAASTHYGHRACFYQKDTDYLIWCENPGLIYEMYHFSLTEGHKVEEYEKAEKRLEEMGQKCKIIPERTKQLKSEYLKETEDGSES